jgi:hypothetical protein
MWGLPAVELAPGADARRALAGALSDRLGVHAAVGPAAAVVERELTHRALVLEVHRARVAGRLGAGRRADPALRWATPRDMEGLAVSTAMRTAIEAADGGLRPLAEGAPGAVGPGRAYPTERS